MCITSLAWRAMQACHRRYTTTCTASVARRRTESGKHKSVCSPHAQHPAHSLVLGLQLAQCRHLRACDESIAFTLNSMECLAGAWMPKRLATQAGVRGVASTLDLIALVHLRYALKLIPEVLIARNQCQLAGPADQGEICRLNTDHKLATKKRPRTLF